MTDSRRAGAQKIRNLPRDPVATAESQAGNKRQRFSREQLNRGEMQQEFRRETNIITTRVAIFLPNEADGNSPMDLGDLAKSCEALDLAVIFTRPFLFAVEDVAGLPARDAMGSVLACEVLAGKLLAGRDFDFGGDGTDWAKWHEVAETDAQVYNLLFASRDHLRIESDVLGLKPLYRAQVKEGVFICSRLRDLGTLRPDLAKPADLSAINSLLLISHSIGERTTFAKIKRTHAGEVIEWRHKDSVRYTRPRRYVPPSTILNNVGLADAVGGAIDRLAASLKKHCKGGRLPYNLGLTGGFDSRVIAGVLAAEDYDTHAYTFGLWHHQEMRVAKKIAGALKIRHSPLSYDLKSYYKHLPLYLETVEGQMGDGASPLTNLLKIPNHEGALLMIGFIGDSLSSAHLSNWFAGKTIDSFDQAAEQLGLALSIPLERRQRASELLGHKICIDDLIHEIRGDLCADILPYQSVLLWDMENRQRRAIGTHFLLLGQSFDVVAPFYDPEVMNYWTSMPSIALDDKYLQRQMLKLGFPNLARIPHDQEVMAIIPNLGNQLSGLFERTARRLLARIYGRITGYGKGSIWALAGGLSTKEQRRNMISGIEGNLPNQNEKFGYPLTDAEELLRKLRGLRDHDRTYDPTLRFLMQYGTLASHFDDGRSQE